MTATAADLTTLAGLLELLEAWRAHAAALRARADRIETVHVPLLVRMAQCAGADRAQIAGVLGVSVARVDQVVARGRVFEANDTGAPAWWLDHTPPSLGVDA